MKAHSFAAVTASATRASLINDTQRAGECTNVTDTAEGGNGNHRRGRSAFRHCIARISLPLRDDGARPHGQGYLDTGSPHAKMGADDRRSRAGDGGFRLWSIHQEERKWSIGRADRKWSVGGAGRKFRRQVSTRIFAGRSAGASEELA